MMRKDREVTDFAEIVDIVRRADTIRLGLHDEPYPYVVPLSFGFEAADGKIVFYFHGAQKGLKCELIKGNPHVCVEAGIFHRYLEVQGGGYTVEYESFIGFGKAARVTGDEACRGLDLLMDHCSFERVKYDRVTVDNTAVYKIEIASFTSKRRSV